MASPSTCAICGGGLELAYPGSSTVADAEALSPTCHRAGEHGDLYRCTRCGTVHQPDLPVGPELYALYRQMRDDHYLDEERGRRRTARRLLDVGCGPGLLLDEARQRAYDVRGLELSEASIAHARNTLELPVEQTALT